MTVHLKIDRLVLDGLDSHQADAAAIEQSMRTRLAELIASPRAPERTTGFESIGTQVADSIHAAIPPAARSRL